MFWSSHQIQFIFAPWLLCWLRRRRRWENLWRNWNWIDANFFMWSVFLVRFIHFIGLWRLPFCSLLSLSVPPSSRWDDAAAAANNKKCIAAFNISTKIRHDNQQLGNANVANCFPSPLFCCYCGCWMIVTSSGRVTTSSRGWGGRAVKQQNRFWVCRVTTIPLNENGAAFSECGGLRTPLTQNKEKNSASHFVPKQIMRLFTIIVIILSAVVVALGIFMAGRQPPAGMVVFIVVDEWHVNGLVLSVGETKTEVKIFWGNWVSISVELNAWRSFSNPHLSGSHTLLRCVIVLKRTAEGVN